MKKQIYVLLSLSIFIFSVNLYLQNSINNIGMDLKYASSKVCVLENCFSIEIADTYQKRALGLMNRESISNDSGMLFIFTKEGNHNFWMKNTLIPLDIIWIDENKEISYIEKNAQPCKVEPCETFGPDQKAKYILEINGGLADEMGIKAGDMMTW